MARSTVRRSSTPRAPGPLPHPVLLAAMDDPRPAEVLAYQLGTTLGRAGVPASVEAFVDGSALPPYQQAALAEARPLDPAEGAGGALPGDDVLFRHHDGGELGLARGPDNASIPAGPV